MKTKFIQNFKLLSLALVVLILTGVVSCRKKNYVNTGENNAFDNSRTVAASVYGIVQDEAGQAVSGAVVKTGGYTTITDDNGLFFFNSIITPSRATTIVVTKDGYFHGSRTLFINEFDKHTVRISLLAKGTPEVFNSVSGGTVNFANGLSITFPVNGIVNKATGNPFSGQVYVYAKGIDPTTAFGKTAMPGDLRGIASSGNERLLQSFGMMVAELYDINGNALQIANSSSATLSLMVPASVQGIAPPSIVLWSYDEAKGMWAEDGGAVLEGNKYSGKVNHFSFWNCDKPAAAIKLQMTLQDQNGAPLQNYTVRLTNTVNHDQRTGNTSAGGWVGGLCYPNTAMTVEVFDNNICGFAAPLYTSAITTGAGDMNLGVVTVNLALVSTCSFTATVQDCLGTPITNSAVYIQPLNLILTPNAFGIISYTLPCVPVTPITLAAYDLSNNVYGTSGYTLLAGMNNIGTLNACGNATPYLTINLTNTVTMASATKTFNAPADNLSCYIQGINSTYISASGGGANVYLTMSDTTIGTHSVTAGSALGIGAFTDTLTVTGVSNATFTAFPLFPGEVWGTFNINMIGSPSGDTYTATGTFRIPRNN